MKALLTLEYLILILLSITALVSIMPIFSSFKYNLINLNRKLILKDLEESLLFLNDFNKAELNVTYFLLYDDLKIHCNRNEMNVCINNLCKNIAINCDFRDFEAKTSVCLNIKKEDSVIKIANC